MKHNSPPAAGTRGHFYARRYGGGWRKARKPFTCQQSLCLGKIAAGDEYFDTLAPTTWPATKRICACCAKEELK